MLNLIEVVNELDPPLGQRLVRYPVELGMQRFADVLERIVPHGNSSRAVFPGRGRRTEFPWTRSFALFVTEWNVIATAFDLSGCFASFVRDAQGVDFVSPCWQMRLHTCRAGGR
jgi:hypothetical protein